MLKLQATTMARRNDVVAMINAILERGANCQRERARIVQSLPVIIHQNDMPPFANKWVSQVVGNGVQCIRKARTMNINVAVMLRIFPRFPKLRRLQRFALLPAKTSLPTVFSLCWAYLLSNRNRCNNNNRVSYPSGIRL